jgi:Arc/MetJ-type ribon-helix-helix transcriptional regulator
MARPRRIIDATRIVITGNPQIAAHLDRLVKTGLYGASRAEVAKSLVTRMIEQLINDEFFAKVATTSSQPGSAVAARAQRGRNQSTKSKGRGGERVQGGQ